MQKTKTTRMSDDEVMNNLRVNSRLNLARQQFSNFFARIENGHRQRKPISPIEMRRLEFEAVIAIVGAYNGDQETRDR